MPENNDCCQESGKFFNFFDNTCGEFALYNKMACEVTQQKGIPVKYLPRRLQKKDLVWGEDVLSSFDTVVSTKMYLNNATEFGGSGDLFQKFGLNVDNRLTLTCQKDQLDSQLQVEPMPGDLILFEFNNKLFEVAHVEKERPAFFLFGEIMIYEFTLKLFDYSGEDMATGIDVLDSLNEEFSNTTQDEPDQAQHEFDEIFNFNPAAPFKNV